MVGGQKQSFDKRFNSVFTKIYCYFQEIIEWFTMEQKHES